MLRRIRTYIDSEQGFTLAELLVVILVIGVLAAIALPAFLNQQEKGFDADAKSNARNAVSSIEACFVERHAYTACDTAGELGQAGSRLSAELTDTATKKQGAVAVEATADTYTIVGYSKSDNSFSIAKTAGGTYSRTCTGGGTGGCKSGDVW